MKGNKIRHQIWVLISPHRQRFIVSSLSLGRSRYYTIEAYVSSVAVLSVKAKQGLAFLLDFQASRPVTLVCKPMVNYEWH